MFILILLQYYSILNDYRNFLQISLKSFILNWLIQQNSLLLKIVINQKRIKWYAMWYSSGCLCYILLWRYKSVVVRKSFYNHVILQNDMGEKFMTGNIQQSIQLTDTYLIRRFWRLYFCCILFSPTLLHE